MPAWIEQVWSEWEAAGRSGKLVVNFNRGIPVDLEERAMHFPPEPRPRIARVGKPGPACPECGAEAMMPRDGGTMFVCACGRKMTAAQAGR